MYINTPWKEERMQKDIDENLIISDKAYNAILGAVIVYGFAVNIVTVLYLKYFFMQFNIVKILVVYAIFAILGCFISYYSKSALASFIGYNFLVLPAGGILSILLSEYDWADVELAIIVTGIASVIIMIIATLAPERFINTGGALAIGLVVGVICVGASTLLGYNSHYYTMGFIILFSFYLVHDFSVAQAYPKTINNAVDSALDVWLDVLYLFINIVSMIRDSKDND